MTDEKKTDSKEERLKPDEVIAAQRNRHLFIISAVIVVLAVLIVITDRVGGGDEGQLEEVRVAGGTLEEPAFVKEDIKRIQLWKGTDGEKFELNRDGDTWVVPSRHDAPATKGDVATIITRIMDATRFNRATTTDESQYVLYGLTDDEAVHLRMVGDDGSELLHLLVGRADSGARDFVRIAGEDAPEGVFELTGMGGQLDSLYSSLQLSTTGEPQPRRWLNLDMFDPLPFSSVTQKITIRDGDREIRFERAPLSDPAEDVWGMTSPLRGEADGTTVRSVIDALMNYNAEDLVGTVADDGKKYGVTNSSKWIKLEYDLEGSRQVSQLYFGNEARDGDIYVRLAGGIEGDKFVFVGGDYALTRIFRPVADFMTTVRLEVIPPTGDLSAILIHDEGTVTELVKTIPAAGAPTWDIKQPFERAAERVEISNLVTGLNALRGYAAESTDTREELELGEGLSRRWIVVSVPDNTPDEESQPPEDSEEGGEEGSDEGGEDDSGNEEDDESEPEAPKLKTVTLYFGKTDGGDVPVLMVRDSFEQVYWIKEADVGKLFPDPRNLIKIEPFNVTVRHILISWKGKNPRAGPDETDRTEAEARELADKVAAMARERGVEGFPALQDEYNEDPGGTTTYDVADDSPFVQPFKRLASQLELGEVGIVESDFGLHVMIREK